MSPLLTAFVLACHTYLAWEDPVSPLLIHLCALCHDHAILNTPEEIKGIGFFAYIVHLIINVKEIQHFATLIQLIFYFV